MRDGKGGQNLVVCTSLFSCACFPQDPMPSPSGDQGRAQVGRPLQGLICTYPIAYPFLHLVSLVFGPGSGGRGQGTTRPSLPILPFLVILSAKRSGEKLQTCRVMPTRNFGCSARRPMGTRLGLRRRSAVNRGVLGV